VIENKAKKSKANKKQVETQYQRTHLHHRWHHYREDFRDGLFLSRNRSTRDPLSLCQPHVSYQEVKVCSQLVLYSQCGAVCEAWNNGSFYLQMSLGFKNHEHVIVRYIRCSACSFKAFICRSSWLEESRTRHLRIDMKGPDVSVGGGYLTPTAC
jgi:hypothetical protein